MKAEAAVVIVTHNRPADLDRCLRSVRTQTVPPQVVVLDNACDPGGLPPIPADVLLLRCEAQLGAAAAKNLAFRRVEAPIAVLLDDDSELAAADVIARLLAVFAAAPDVDALALNCVAVNLPEGAERRQMLLAGAVRRGARPATVAGEEAFEVAEFIGAGCAFRMQAFGALGGFREDFIYGYEEFHLALRIMARGSRLLYLPGLAVHHHHSGAWRLSGGVRLASQLRNKWVLAAELLPVAWIPLALGPYTVRAIWQLRREGAARGALRAAAGAFAAGWKVRRPLAPATVRRVVALRGRL